LASALAVVVVAVLGVAFAGTTAGSAAGESLGRDAARSTAGLHAPSDAGTALDGGEASGTLSVTAHGDDDGDGHMMGDWDWNGGWWSIMPIMMVVFWGGVIAVAVWGIRQFARGRDGGRSPVDIARERYAKGEVTAEEFERLRRDLS
jgi:putative membrane protein